MTVILDTIDFISAYCDRWCERCAFTSRCSAYAVRAAIAMCDNDFERALKLTFGPAPDGPPRRHSRLIEQFANYMPTEKELAGFTREKEESEERIDEFPLKTTSQMASLLSSQWLTDRRERILERADPALAEAIEVAEWDCYFICAKLYRAMSGRDEAQHSQERDQDDDHLQSDWNGSAKVALISIVRSTEAWTLIGHATGDPDASAIADLFAQLRRQVEEAFPDAWKFVRPGFDTEK